MWFKNLRIYRLTESFEHSPEALNEALEKFAFQPCGSLDPIKYGWTKPLGRHGVEYIHATNGYIMICAKRQEKILPSGVIKEALEEKILEISTNEGRHVARAERQTLKDEIIFSLLPKAFAKTSLDFAYIDTRENLIICNVSSSKRAEELLSALREALGRLKVVPLISKNTPVHVMTNWLNATEATDKFEIGEECELIAPKDGRVIRCKNQDLTAHEIRSHIESNMLVNKLAVSWNEAIHCVIDDQLCIKRIKYEDSIVDKANERHPESAAEEFDVEFSIMSLELSAFIRSLVRAFGGVNKDKDFDSDDDSSPSQSKPAENSSDERSAKETEAVC